MDIAGVEMRGVPQASPAIESPDTATFAHRVSRLTLECVEIWNHTIGGIPGSMKRFTREEQIDKENELERFLLRAPEVPKDHRSFLEERRSEVWSPVRTAILKLFSRDGNPSTKQFFDDCERAAEEFIKGAERFDPRISPHDIRQALRNLWVFNSLQCFLGRRVCMTPSSFAYSLLYPYTDNWLDDPERTLEEKQIFLRWLTQRLAGEHHDRSGRIYTIMDRLLSMIDQEYPRSAYPDVASALCAIHAAQERSVRLQGKPDHDREETLLALSIEKGGTSVLADAFLVEGGLSTRNFQVLFEYGVMLQLIDDLQDMEEDGDVEHSTCFLRASRDGNLNGMTERLFGFVEGIACEMNGGTSPRQSGLVPLIVQSCNLLILEAAARYNRYYSGEFLKVLEGHMPFRLAYLAALRRKVKRKY